MQKKVFYEEISLDPSSNSIKKISEDLVDKINSIFGINTIYKFVSGYGSYIYLPYPDGTLYSDNGDINWVPCIYIGKTGRGTWDLETEITPALAHQGNGSVYIELRFFNPKNNNYKNIYITTGNCVWNGSSYNDHYSNLVNDSSSWNSQIYLKIDTTITPKCYGIGLCSNPYLTITNTDIIATQCHICFVENLFSKEKSICSLSYPSKREIFFMIPNTDLGNYWDLNFKTSSSVYFDTAYVPSNALCLLPLRLGDWGINDAYVTWATSSPLWGNRGISKETRSKGGYIDGITSNKENYRYCFFYSGTEPIDFVAVFKD